MENMIQRAIRYIMIFTFSCYYMVTGIPQFIKALITKKVIFKEPDFLNDSKYGEHKYLNLKDFKLSIHYVCNGQKGKPLMLFLHGFPEFWYSWRYQLPFFGQDYYAVAIDMLGYGKSSKPNNIEMYSLEHLASITNSIIGELGYESCILVGHDFGAFVSYRVAEDYPQVVSKLIIMNGAPSNNVFRSELSKRNKWSFLKYGYMFFFQIPYLPEFWLSSNNYNFINLFREGFMEVKNLDNFTEEDCEAYKYQFQEGGFTGPVNYYRNLFKNTSTAKYDMPTLLVWGTEDGLSTTDVPESQKCILNNCRTCYVDNASHWVFIDAPEEVNAAVKQFIQEY